MKANMTIDGAWNDRVSAASQHGCSDWMWGGAWRACAGRSRRSHIPTSRKEESQQLWNQGQSVSPHKRGVWQVKHMMNKAASSSIAATVQACRRYSSSARGTIRRRAGEQSCTLDRHLSQGRRYAP